MKILSLELKNFKRFTDLVLSGIPANTKLVLLIGSNGSGKSSVFDAFEFFNSCIRGDALVDSSYYRKNPTDSFAVQFTDDMNHIWTADETTFVSSTKTERRFYGRSSFRQTPKLSRISLGEGRTTIEQDSDRPRSFIDKDNRFENDIEAITGTILREIFRSKDRAEQIRSRYIDPINRALENIFGGQSGTQLVLLEIIPPLEGRIAQVTFRKGNSEIHYNVLSAGEKEVVNILFNLLSRKSLYTDSVYFLDEIDLHLSTKIQFNLLRELCENWIPADCQLWTASHSLGFIDFAKNYDSGVIIDFDDFNFDSPRVLTPEPKDNPDVYEIAVGKELLPSLFQEMDVFFVENKDRDLYGSIGIPKTVFVSDNNRNNVYHKVRSTGFGGIVDRDFLTDSDVAEIKLAYPKLRVLNYYCLENYLYHPDNLAAYHKLRGLEFNRGQYIIRITEEKNKVRDDVIVAVAMNRQSYPYFGEPEFNGDVRQQKFKVHGENARQAGIIQQYLSSDDFETFYKVFSMKDYCRQLPERQNISKTELAKTDWFKSQIETILK